jgi:hypothetical protein
MKIPANEVCVYFLVVRDLFFTLGIKIQFEPHTNLSSMQQN